MSERARNAWKKLVNMGTGALEKEKTANFEKKDDIDFIDQEADKVYMTSLPHRCSFPCRELKRR